MKTFRREVRVVSRKDKDNFDFFVAQRRIVVTILDREFFFPWIDIKRYAHVYGTVFSKTEKFSDRKAAIQFADQYKNPRKKKTMTPENEIWHDPRRFT
jgi:hypothetical protein